LRRFHECGFSMAPTSAVVYKTVSRYLWSLCFIPGGHNLIDTPTTSCLMQSLDFIWSLWSILTPVGHTLIHTPHELLCCLMFIYYLYAPSSHLCASPSFTPLIMLPHTVSRLYIISMLHPHTCWPDPHSHRLLCCLILSLDYLLSLCSILTPVCQTLIHTSYCVASYCL
jgi:hypothetical protein